MLHGVILAHLNVIAQTVSEHFQMNLGVFNVLEDGSLQLETADSNEKSETMKVTLVASSGIDVTELKVERFKNSEPISSETLYLIERDWNRKEKEELPRFVSEPPEEWLTRPDSLDRPALP
jgi:hypothetical protein